MKKLVLVIGFLLFSSTAQALTISADGTYTTDESSGLDWRAFAGTINKSYNEISSQFDVGESFEGWRYATFNEAITFISNIAASNNITPEVQAWSTNNIGLTDAVGYYLGYTHTNNANQNGIYGLTGTLNHPPPIGTTAKSIYLQEGQGDELYSFNVNINSISTPAHWLGSYLVRNTVPEPSTLLLLGTSLVGIAGVEVRRKYKKESSK